MINITAHLQRAAGEVSRDPSKVLSFVLQELQQEHPWFYDLATDQIYADDLLKEIYGVPQDAVSISYEDLMQNEVFISGHEDLERMKMRCLQELKRVEFIFHAKRLDTGKGMRILAKCQPLLNAKGNVIALYGTDRLLETFDLETSN